MSNKKNSRKPSRDLTNDKKSNTNSSGKQNRDSSSSSTVVNPTVVTEIKTSNNKEKLDNIQLLLVSSSS